MTTRFTGPGPEPEPELGAGSKEIGVQEAPQQQSDPVLSSVPEKEIETVQATSEAEVPYSIFTINEKRFMTFILTFASLFSPISTTIYYPALAPIADELHVSSTLINLTITTFMVGLKFRLPPITPIL